MCVCDAQRSVSAKEADKNAHQRRRTAREAKSSRYTLLYYIGVPSFLPSSLLRVPSLTYEQVSSV